MEKKRVVGVPDCKKECEKCPQTIKSNCPPPMLQARLKFFHLGMKSLLVALGLEVKIVDGKIIGIFSGSKLAGSIHSNAGNEPKLVNPEEIKFMKLIDELIVNGSVEIPVEDEKSIQLTKDNLKANNLNYEVERTKEFKVKISVL